MTGERITLLSATRDGITPMRMCKRFTALDGTVTKEDYDHAFHYWHQEVDANSIQDLGEILDGLEDMESTCIIRGRLRPNVNPEALVLRRKSDANDGQGIFYEEDTTGLHWGMMDFDKVPCPNDMCPLEIGGAGAPVGIEYLVGLLPIEFHHASYCYQWSSSSGVNGWGALSAHIWFWFDRPHTDTEMCAWAIHQGEVDDATFRTVQPLYTAKPLFVGMSDPLGGRRSGIVIKACDEVAMPNFIKPPPPITTQMGIGTSFTGNRKNRFSELLGEIGPRYHMPIQRAIAHYVGVNGTRTDRVYLKTVVIDAINNGITGKNNKNDYLQDRYLDGSIEGAVRKYGSHTPLTALENIRNKINKNQFRR